MGLQQGLCAFRSTQSQGEPDSLLFAWKVKPASLSDGSVPLPVVPNDQIASAQLLSLVGPQQDQSFLAIGAGTNLPGGSSVGPQLACDLQQNTSYAVWLEELGGQRLFVAASTVSAAGDRGSWIQAQISGALSTASPGVAFVKNPGVNNGGYRGTGAVVVVWSGSYDNVPANAAKPQLYYSLTLVPESSASVLNLNPATQQTAIPQGFSDAGAAIAADENGNVYVVYQSAATSTWFLALGAVNLDNQTIDWNAPVELTGSLLPSSAQPGFSLAFAKDVITVPPPQQQPPQGYETLASIYAAWADANNQLWLASFFDLLKGLEASDANVVAIPSLSGLGSANPQAISPSGCALTSVYSMGYSRGVLVAMWADPSTGQLILFTTDAIVSEGYGGLLGTSVVPIEHAFTGPDPPRRILAPKPFR